MPTAAETALALYGAYRLARFDASGMRFFETTIEGFWRSFFAAVLVAPFYAIIVALELAERIEPYEPVWAIVVLVVAYAASWAAFPIVAIFITRLLGLSPRYVPFIIAYNWASVPQTLVYFPVIMISAAHLVPPALAEFLLLAAFLYILVYQWFVTLTALETTGLTAAGIVIVQVLLDLLIHRGASSLI